MDLAQNPWQKDGGREKGKKRKTSRIDGDHDQVQKVRGCVRKANKGDSFVNNLRKLSPNSGGV